MRRTYFLLALTVALVGCLGRSAHAQGAPQLGSAEKAGRSIFQTRCAMCHVGQEPAVEMQNTGAARRPATMGPLLSKANTTNEDALRTKIKDGSARMPGYKHTLTDEEVNQVIAFMKTIDKPLTRLYLTRAGE